MLSCFGSGVDSQRLDRDAFKFQHTLLGHPSLTLENLARVVPALPSDKVTYSQSLLKNGDDFEGTFSKPPKDRSIDRRSHREHPDLELLYYGQVSRAPFVVF